MKKLFYFMARYKIIETPAFYNGGNYVIQNVITKEKLSVQLDELGMKLFSMPPFPDSKNNCESLNTPSDYMKMMFHQMNCSTWQYEFDKKVRLLNGSHIEFEDADLTPIAFQLNSLRKFKPKFKQKNK